MERLKMSDTAHCHGCGVEVHPLVIGDTVAHFNCSTCGAKYLIVREVYTDGDSVTEYVADER